MLSQHDLAKPTKLNRQKTISLLLNVVSTITSHSAKQSLRQYKNLGIRNMSLDRKTNRRK